MVQLGDRVKDSLSGFEGIATGRGEYLYGCVQVFVTPTRLDKDGNVADGHWFDEGRLAIVAAGAVERPASADVREGGPLTCPEPPRH